VDGRPAGPRGELWGGTAEAREKLLEAARHREIDVVLVWRLDRWGRSVTDLLATLQELEHLGVGFVSLTEALDLTTAVGRAMAGLLAVFAVFEREVLQERTKAGLAHARENGKRLGRPATAAIHAGGDPETAPCRRQQIRNRSARPDRAHLRPPNPDSTFMKRPKRDPVREDRIYNEALVDARPEEQAMSWYYLEGKITFPFRARCVAANAVSPLRKGETVEVLRMAIEVACEHDMLVQIRWQGRKMAVSLSQLETISADESTQEAIGDWHYWVAQGCIF
jgi:hypothetical protein